MKELGVCQLLRKPYEPEKLSPLVKSLVS
jgi:hypothetical protein